MGCIDDLMDEIVVLVESLGGCDVVVVEGPVPATDQILTGSALGPLRSAESPGRGRALPGLPSTPPSPPAGWGDVVPWRGPDGPPPGRPALSLRPRGHEGDRTPRHACGAGALLGLASGAADLQAPGGPSRRPTAQEPLDGPTRERRGSPMTRHHPPPVTVPPGTRTRPASSSRDGREGEARLEVDGEGSFPASDPPSSWTWDPPVPDVRA